MCEGVSLSFVHRGKPVLAQISILEAVHVFYAYFLLALSFEYGFHRFTQSEHTVLQGFLHLVHSAFHSLLVSVASQCSLVYFGVAIPIQLVISCTTIGLLLDSIVAYFQFVLLGHIFGFSQYAAVSARFCKVLVASPKYVAQLVVRQGYA